MSTDNYVMVILSFLLFLMQPPARELIPQTGLAKVAWDFLYGSALANLSSLPATSQSLASTYCGLNHCAVTGEAEPPERIAWPYV